MIAILRAVAEGQPFPLAPEGAGSFALDGTWPEEALAANGYLRFGKRAVRADLAERLGWEIAKRRKEAGKNAFPIEIDLASVVSCPADDWPAVLKGFGLAPAEKDKDTDAVLLWRYAARARPDGRPERGRDPGGGTRHQTGGGKGGKGPRGNRPQGGGGRGPARNAPASRKPDPDSPFAALAALLPEEKPKPKKKKRKPKPAADSAAPQDAAGAGSGFAYTPFR
jgi:ATP-dependent RNA helicase SUPV3L1/SUV3